MLLSWSDRLSFMYRSPSFRLKAITDIIEVSSRSMPSAFSHAIASVALGRAYTTRKLPLRFWVLSAGCALAPDLDVAFNRLGIGYSELLGHRGITHSILFAIVLSGGVLLLAFRRPITGLNRVALFLYFFLVTASHAILDAMVDGMVGVAFFAPFSSARYFLPWRPIVSSPIGMAFFTSDGATVLMNEFVYIWVPSLIVILTPWLRGRFLTGREDKKAQIRGQLL